MTPRRIQLRRSRGWRQPEGAVVVSRPSRWGNPFHVKPASSAKGGPPDMWAVVYEDRVLVRWDDRRIAAADAVHRYRQWVAETGMDMDVRTELAGKDLACWCRIGDPCHAGALLEIANHSSETQGA